MEAILHTVQQYQNEPQTSAAAIAAVFKMSPKARALLKKLSFNEQMLTLAALQHVDVERLDLTSLPINVETASPELLKLALVVVGLDRAPANMMHPRFKNSEIVKVLGGHHDNVVAQYTVWAITENPSLSLRDIGIDIRLVEDQPLNVRAWIYRLIAMMPEDAERNFEYVELGSRDSSPEARAGLAGGLKKTYFDGIESLILDWFLKEGDSETSQCLLDHMIIHADECPNYKTMVLEIYEREPPSSNLRRRMEAMAAGTSLYSEFKRTDTQDLFGGSTVTNNTFNISGGIQGGAVSVGGDATNSGQTLNQYSADTLTKIHTQLSRLEREVHESNLEDQIKGPILDQLKLAKESPTPGALSKLVSTIRHGGELVLAGTTIWEIGQAIANLAGFG